MLMAAVERSGPLLGMLMYTSVRHDGYPIQRNMYTLCSLHAPIYLTNETASCIWEDWVTHSEGWQLVDGLSGGIACLVLCHQKSRCLRRTSSVGHMLAFTVFSLSLVSLLGVCHQFGTVCMVNETTCAVYGHGLQGE
jgi:hypothetical protein